MLDEDGNPIGEGEQRADLWIVLEPVARAIPSSSGTPDDIPWLFPGGHPGRPLTDSQIGKRPHNTGVPKQDRSTALFNLATELPAAILAQMLGVHTKVAVQWQKASAGDWAV